MVENKSPDGWPARHDDASIAKLTRPYKEYDLVFRYLMLLLQIRRCVLFHGRGFTRLFSASSYPSSCRAMSVFNATRIIGKTVLVTGASSGIGAVSRWSY